LWHVDEPVLSAPIADSCTHFLDEHRTRGFNGYAGQNSARGVFDDADNGCLLLLRAGGVGYE
jgi:hypothetical protein